MSLNALEQQHVPRCAVILKTADQYSVWKSRVGDACWVACHRDIWSVTAKECNVALKDYAADTKSDWVGRCWMIITSSLHDELYTRVSHVQRGQIPGLLKEIAHALVVNTAEDVQPLRLQVYGGTMQKDADNDLQKWIAFLTERANKLEFLENPLRDEEMLGIFLKGLNSVFNPLQIHFAIPGQMPKTFIDGVEIARKYAATPLVAAELAKLRANGLTQTAFIATAGTPSASNRALCRLYSRTGTCRFGSKCKFIHTTSPSSTNPPAASSTTPVKCSFCGNRGHTVEVCRKKQAQQGRPSASSLIAANDDQDALQDAVVHAVAADDSSDLKRDAFAFVFIATNGEHTPHWVMDSGATCCATYSENDCTDIHSCNISVTAAGSSFIVTKMGTAVVNALDEQGRVQKVTFRNCLISPKFPYKLLALQLFTSKGHQIQMEKDTMRITSPLNDIVLVGQRDSKSQLYYLQEAPAVPTASLLARSYGGETDADLLWKLHLRHGHRNFVDVARQYNLPIPKTIPACTSCVMGKSHVHPHLSNGFERATRRAEGFHSDFRGPFSVPTPHGELYLLTLTDDFTRRLFGFLCKSQSEWSDIWPQFVLRVEAEIGRPNCVSWILTDNGAVYKSGTMTAFCASKGIQQRFSAPYAQWMDHTAERNMRTIGEMAVTTLIHSNLPKSAWGYATLHAVDVINRTAESGDLNKAAGFPNNFSRLEKWKGHQLPGQTKGLYPFGCLAFKHVPSAIRATKLDQHANPCVYLGIDAKSRAYLLGSLYDLNTSVSVEVTFMENVFPFRKIKHRESPSSLLWGTDHNMAEGDPRLGMFADESPLTKVLDRNTLKSIGAIPSTDGNLLEAKSKPPDATRYSVRQTQAPSRLTYSRPSLAEPEDNPKNLEEIDSHDMLRRYGGDSITTLAPGNRLLSRRADNLVEESPESFTTLFALTESELQTITPHSPEQALQSKSREQWLAAMNREKQCHLKNGTFGEEWKGPGECPKPVPAGWVFKIKHRGPAIEEDDLQPKQFKARVVIRGQYMKEGLDFNDTFAPVAKPMTIRAVLAVATKYGCRLKAGDVETAFLTADMDCEVWVKMPSFWGPDHKDITGKIYDNKPRRLLKGVPGIPQGSRLYYETFAAQLTSMGWTPSSADKCLFLNQGLQERTAVIIWVDDFIFMHENESTWERFLADLRKRFTIPTVGTLTTFLGMDIRYDEGARTMSITQPSCVQSLLERAGMLECNSVPTPCATGIVWTKQDCPQTPDPQSCTDYRKLIALANFVSCWTRPDITYTVNKLCKYMSNPGEAHWRALKHLLRYLKGTQDKGLYFDFGVQNPGVQGVHGYTDASYADCPDSGKSTVAYVFYLGSAIISWYSKLHSFVTTSTNHSEYAALALGAKEAQWLVYLFEQLEPEIKHVPMPVYTDNSGVISLIFNPVDHAANKHIRVGCHFARELTQEGVIAPQRVSTDLNLADLFTKALAGPAFKLLVDNYVKEVLTKSVISSRGGVGQLTDTDESKSAK